MPYFVYILFSKKDHKLYVGCTHDYEHRLKEHNQGKVPATKNRRPLEIIYLEKYEVKSEAFNRERFLKTLWSARFKKKILNEYINKIGHNI
ncbi:MAG: hypothetical protein RL687_415 [Candidatus Parcubacteria bacterium]|jgi:putative endonuclease